jgi:hypothetical protein
VRSIHSRHSPGARLARRFASAIACLAFSSEVISAFGKSSTSSTLLTMWATARSVEQGEPLYIYAYATRSEQKWLFDMHIINPGEPPSFGWDVPHLYVPMSAIFIAVYTDCKKLLGISGQTTFDL